MCCNHYKQPTSTTTTKLRLVPSEQSRAADLPRLVFSFSDARQRTGGRRPFADEAPPRGGTAGQLFLYFKRDAFPTRKDASDG